MNQHKDKVASYVAEACYGKPCNNAIINAYNKTLESEIKTCYLRYATIAKKEESCDSRHDKNLVKKDAPYYNSNYIYYLW